MKPELETAISALADHATAFLRAAHHHADPTSRLARARESLGPERYIAVVEEELPRAARRQLERLVRSVPHDQVCDLDLLCFLAGVVREVSAAVGDAAGLEAEP